MAGTPNKIEINNRAGIDFVTKKFPEKTAINLECITGISARTIENWLNGATDIGAPLLLALISELGPDFLDAILSGRVKWVARAAKINERDELIRSTKAAQKRLAQIDDELKNGE